MALGFINDATLTDIADAIREKKEISDLMFPGEMAELIRSIETGVSLPSWITELEFATATVGTETTSLSIPCSMSSAPTSILMWASTYKATSSTSVYGNCLELKLSNNNYQVSGYMRNQATGGGSANYNGSYDVTVSKSGNTLKVTVTTSLATVRFTAGSTFRVIMWR